MLFNTKKSIMIAFSSLVITGTSFVGAVYAQEYRYPPADALEPPVQNVAPTTTITRQPARVNQGYPMPYPVQNFPPQRRFNPAPIYGAPGNRPMPYQPAPYGSAPIAGARPMGPGMAPPYGNPYNRNPYNNSGPFNNRPFGGGPFNNGPFGGGPFKNMGFGPFNNNSTPWETWPFGGRDSFWSRKEMPFDQQNPTDWFNPGDPKEGLAIMWDDLISSPDDLGTMPGGWYVPSVSVPNPVDLEDQMEKATKEVPDLIRIYN